MNGVILFNAVVLVFCAATGAGVLPSKLYNSFLRGLHATIGITTPTDRQLRWVLVVWALSTLFIVDGLLALLVYVF
jgi:hypothetical protein